AFPTTHFSPLSLHDALPIFLDFGFIGNRLSSNSQFNFFNPNISTTLNFVVTQPLLQGRRNLQFRTPLMIARTQLLITSEQSEARSEEHTSELQSRFDLVCRL